jgi:hypothetical protein
MGSVLAVRMFLGSVDEHSRQSIQRLVMAFLNIFQAWIISGMLLASQPLIRSNVLWR